MPKSYIPLIVSILLAVNSQYVKGSTNAINPPIWLQYFGNQKISNKLNWHDEVQVRNLDKQLQSIVRTGVGFNLKPNVNLLGGYGFIWNKQNLKGSTSHTIEHRTFQQLIVKHQLGRLSVFNRYRFEQRFFSKEPINLRHRYFLALYYPINKKDFKKGTFYVGNYAEIFLKQQPQAFDQFRAYVSLGYALNDFLKLEIGYLHQQFGNKYHQFAQVALFNNLSFSRLR
jgi:hypothetical protein